jgi:hypothetical protein
MRDEAVSGNHHARSSQKRQDAALVDNVTSLAWSHNDFLPLERLLNAVS